MEYDDLRIHRMIRAKWHDFTVRRKLCGNTCLTEVKNPRSKNTLVSPN